MASEIHVSPTGDDSNQGGAEAMLRTISEASQRAQPGDVITVHGGVYRERIAPPRGGTSADERIVYRAAPGEEVVIKGSEPVSGWTHVSDDTWSVTLPNHFFGELNPFNNVIIGDWFTNKNRTHHTGAVYLNGHWLTETTSRQNVLQPAGSSPLWFAEVEGGGYLMNLNWFQPYAGEQPGVEVDAFSFDHDLGIVGAPASEGGDCLGFVEDGDWARYEQIDFGVNADSIRFRISSAQAGCIEIRLDSRDGQVLGTCQVPATGGFTKWQTLTAAITPTSGLQKVCLVFRSENWETATTTIWAQFPGVNPNKETVEVNSRQTVFYPKETGINYITVQGFILEQAATPWAPPSAEQIALIGPNWSKGWIIKDNTIRYSTCAGLSIGKYGDRWDNRCTQSGNYAQNFVGYISRCIDSGWSKDTIGGHLIENNHIYHCEQVGIVGCMGGVFCTIRGNLIHDIYQRRLFAGAEMACIKLHGSIDSVIANNHIFGGNFGLWLDWMTQGTRVTKNILRQNDTDLFLEVNHGPALIDHNFFLSPKSVYDRSEAMAYTHNVIAGTFRFQPDTNRQTPYFLPHSTSLEAYVNIPGGDDRFYNNIFIGPSASLSPYNVTAKPVSMGGNVFLNGAVASSIEDNPLIQADVNPNVQITAQDDGYYITMAVDLAWVTQRNRALITSELLGQGALTKQRFDQFDGSNYRLDTDFPGKPRDTANPSPGAFAISESGKVKIKVSSLLAPEDAPKPPTLPPGHPQTLFHEDFDDGSPEPHFYEGDGYGSPSTSFTDSFTITSQESSRIYLGSYKTNFHEQSFVFEASVSIPNTTSPWSATFFGMGTPQALSSYYGEPITGSHALLVLRNDANRIESRKNSTSANQINSVGNLAGNTHRLRMIWDKNSHDATFEIDLLHDGSIDESFTLNFEDDGFNDSHTQLILGGGNGLIFDNITVTQFKLPFKISGISHNGSSIQLDLDGLDTDKTYILTRSSDLQDGFPVTIGPPFTPDQPYTSINDLSPPASYPFFYRVEEVLTEL
ncbi:carbohydrate-binding protein [Verrucomicrobiaceae bacterium N1E253]|uniref:Carbohydrate-binding protein n=2 Tax=Oceaniferula marina TaxID=2748318 RepID=A0A851GRC4_9BACT|nr:carbohydrate-binding protein [Oceaniferula marina]